MIKRVLFFSSVKDKNLFYIQRFYQVDISILEQLGYQVLLSNNVADSLKFWKYDFVFAYFYRYAFFVALIARLFGKRSYFTGGIDSLDKNLASRREYFVQQLFFRLCYLVSKSCIIVSKSDDKNVRNIVKGDKLSYSEHSIETAPLKCNLCDKENIFVTIGWQATVGNVQRKGIDTAIKLFAKLRELPEYYNSIFYVIGKKGVGTHYLENLVNDLNIENYVVFTDSISEKEKIDYLKRSKHYFQLSIYEGFGVAALEALGAKNIVIHSGKGGLSNPIYNDGILVEIEKPLEEMIEKLKTELKDFNSSRLESAYQNVLRKYDNERRKMDFENIIKE